MAARRALECRDILTEIFEAMSAIYDEDIFTGADGPWRSDLASAACVCRAFTEPALAVLWRSLDDVQPVFRVLPSFIRQESGLAYEWLITEEVTPDQWARMQWYASRVRELHGLDAFKSMHSSVWAFLEGVRGNRPLLPNLRRLTAVLSIEDPSVLMRILSPSLHEVKLAFAFTESLSSGEVTGVDASAVGSVIQVVPSRVPHLRDLSVRGCLQSLSSSYLTSLHRFQQLRTLDMLWSSIAFDSKALNIVSQMSSLTVLEVEISLQTTSDSTEELLLAGDFSSLTQIHIGGSLADLVRFFAATRLKNLRELSLTLPSAPSEQAIHDSFVRITAEVSPSLTNVNLYFTSRHISPSPSFSASRIFRSLLRFSQLTEFNVEFDCAQYPPIFDDDDAAAFAAAWPELSYFRFWPSSLRLCRPTISGLVEFARHCPRLEDIHLPSLDVASLPPPASIPALARHSMRRLYIEPLVGASQTNLLELAVILDRLFPNLQAPRSATPSQFHRAGEHLVPDPQHEPWRLTEILLGALQLRRKHLASDPPDDDIESDVGDSLHNEMEEQWED
ncbi:hypothetical protein K466DRAFT_529217 [Polyporus arcularius HHB13444]|uniref:F-box domain-containing protein n=1 Tax=Polyporus arcularius HHB13444 TaxID=1314778 RepID=A0A5C3P2I9_9APHY|nr:hypothetical protein K466DRAFT_529217 [Polyporus arcularius HHB13444]